MRALLFAALAVVACGDSPKPKPIAVLSISMELPGAAPRHVEQDMVEPIERAVGQLEGIAEITSRIEAGTAKVVVTPVVRRNIDELVHATHEALESVRRDLPPESFPPVLQKLPVDDTPIMTLGIEGERLSRTELSELADVVVRRKLEVLNGVGRIEARGVSLPALIVRPDPQKLAAYGVTVVDLTAALQRQNVDLPGGRIDATAQDMRIRISGQPLDVETAGAMLVGQRGDAPVYLRDVATLEIGPEKPPEGPAPRLDVHAQIGVSHDEVRARVREKLAELALPAGVKVGQIATERPATTELVTSILGPDLAVLDELAAGLVKELGPEGVVRDPPAGTPEQVIEVDRERAAMLGISAGAITETISVAMGSQHIGEVMLGGESRNLVMQMPSASPEQILTLSVRRSDGGLVTVADVVTVKAAMGQPSLLRRNRQRAIDLRAPAAAVAKARKRIEQEAAKWPTGYRAVVPR